MYVVFLRNEIIKTFSYNHRFFSPTYKKSLNLKITMDETCRISLSLSMRRVPNVRTILVAVNLPGCLPPCRKMTMPAILTGP